MSPPLDGFAPHFDSRRLVPARDAETMRRIHALRFSVYCVECGFLPAEQYRDGLECDLHDAGAAHFCAVGREGNLAGYVRLVKADAEGRFPFQGHCATLFDHVRLPDPRSAGEISRLMVHERYRRRRGDTLAGITVEDHAAPALERRNDSPQIMLSMFRQMYAYSVSNDIRYWYAAMERTLARALMRLGFAFNLIGPETDYYGPVAPYLADLRELESKVGQAKPDLLEWMREPLA